jgi:cell division protein FtsB
MAFRLHHSSSFTKIVIIAELFIVSYLLYTLTVSIYRSYQIDQYLLEFKRENDRIAMEIKQKEQDLSYVTSEAYAEKFAKQNFNLVNPGEEVIIVPSSKEGEVLTEETGPDGTPLKSRSNPQNWWKFFFDNREQKP